MKEEYCIIYEIKFFDGGLKYYYPIAHIAKKSAKGPSYIEKLATKEVIDSYGLVTKNTVDEKLLMICEDLSIASIEKTFNKNRKGKISINQLFEDNTAKATIQNRISRGFDEFLKIMQQHGKSPYKNVDRKIHLENSKLKFSPLDFTVKFCIDKTQTGTNASLYFYLNEDLIKPMDIAFDILLASPTYLLSDNTIFQIKNFDGKKLIPFQTKETVFVPSHLTSKYFNSIFKEILLMAEVEVNGFDYIIKDDAPKSIIKFSTGFSEDNYEVIPIFKYENYYYSYGDKQSYRLKIDIDDENHIEVKRQNRNFDAENTMIEVFDKHNMERTASYRFKKTSHDPYHTLLYVLSNRKSFELNGWEIEFPKIKDTEIDHNPSMIEEVVQESIDWFEIKSIIKVGDEEIPFGKLMKHIKDANRIFSLKNGKIFIVPIEWFEKYDTLSKFATEEGGKVILKKIHASILDGLNNEISENERSNNEESKAESIASPASLNATLRSYQLQGFNWLYRHYMNKMGACLADDMGLGKTLQTITLLCKVKEQIGEIFDDEKNSGSVQLSLFETYNVKRKALRALVVAPSSLVFNWEREIKKFTTGLMIKSHVGLNRDKQADALKHFDVVLTSYPIVIKDAALFKQNEYEIIVIDEAQYIKNRDSKVFKTLSELKAQCKISLSGTPIENSLADLWSQMQFINPEILHTYPKFKKMYQDPIEKYRDTNALSELKTILNPFILRRTKSEVLDDLPDLDELIHYCEMEEDQAKLIEVEKSKARNFILGIDKTDHKEYRFHVFAALMKLRQLANHPAMVDKKFTESSAKYIEVTNSIESLLKSDNKLILFSSFRGHLDIYVEYLKETKVGYSIITGDVKAEDRKKAVDKFNEDDDCKVILISLKAGGTGLNLTAANYVFLLDPWWNPFIEEQAKARAHRIGQKRRVTVIKFITNNSIEEKILKLQNNKIDLVKDFMEEQRIQDMDLETIEELFL